MKKKTKIMFTKDYIFRLTYHLSVKKGEFFIGIYSEKFEKNLFCSNGEPLPHTTESCIEKLPRMSFRKALWLFDTVSENFIFPDKLSKTVENKQSEFDEFLPVT